MQKSQQSQPGDHRDVSLLMDEEVRVCDTCGAVGFEHCLAICNKCTDGAEHIYCMSVKLAKVPEGDWTCQECMPRAGTNKLVQDKYEEAARKLKGHLTESMKSSKLNSRSSYAGKSGTNGASSPSHLSAKRHGILLESQSLKNTRAVGSSAVCPSSSRLFNNSLHYKEKIRSNNEIIYSLPQTSCYSQETAMFPHACTDKRDQGTSEGMLDKKGKAPETWVISPNPSKPPFKKLGKVTLDAAGNVAPQKQSSCDTKEKAKLSFCLGDESPKLGSQAEIAHDKCMKSRSFRAANLKSKGQLAKASGLQKQKVERNPTFCGDRKGPGSRMVSKSMSFNSIKSGKSNATCSEVLLANVYELHNPETCLPAFDSGTTAKESEMEAISNGGTLFSGSTRCNLDAAESSEQLDYILQPSYHNTHKDPSCPNAKKKSQNREAELPIKAATAMSIYESCSDLAFDGRSRSRDLAEDEAATRLVSPNPHYMWLGKFQIHSSGGIASTCDGIQAHLSTFALLNVLEVVDRLPKIITLVELPRSKMWASQFMGSQANKENIALYFTAKDLDSYVTSHRKLMDYMNKNDLALKGNLDGVELFIFPSNILPEKTQRWNGMLFLWGVFRGQKMNYSANTLVSNSLELQNGDTVRPFDLDANPKDEDGMTTVDEIPESDRIGARPFVGESSIAKGGEEKQPKGAAVGLNVSQWSRSGTPDGCKLGVHNFERPSTTLSLAPSAPSIYEESMDLVDMEVAETLLLLKRDRF